MTQLEAARQGLITPAMQSAAAAENVAPEVLRAEIARGAAVLLGNNRRRSAGSETGVAPAAAPPGRRADAAGARLWTNRTVSERRCWLQGLEAARKDVADALPLHPVAVGRRVSTKINLNLGTSPEASDPEAELAKLRLALEYGADAVMDLSTGGDLDEIRAALIAASPVPLGTVPLYGLIARQPIEDLTADQLLAAVAHQARQGVDFVTLHCGLLREHLPLIARRKQGIVSRGGALLATWMARHNRQNPLYERFDDLSAILRESDVTYSLGDGLRPGCLADAGDAAQIAELRVLGELVQRARAAGVQVMVEGPGHVPMNEIAAQIEQARRLCDDAPFYVLGPVVADVFPGFDHITSAIGATEAARAGAALLCAVTPREHVGLPDADDIRAGCIAYRIAAHAGDVARGVPGAAEWDERMAEARRTLDWRRQFVTAFDGAYAAGLRGAVSKDEDFCTMCGRKWCSQRLSGELTEGLRKS